MQAQFEVALTQAQVDAGVTTADLDRLEALRYTPREERTAWSEVAAAPTTGLLENILQEAVDNLLPLVPPEWLRVERAKPRNTPQSGPLELVGGTRIERRPGAPTRYAKMLLLAIDHLERAVNRDIHTAARLVPELAMLGSQLDHIASLGSLANERLSALHTMDNSRVASCIHELLVGAALVRFGREPKMLREDPEAKTPDFRLENFFFPIVVECKRRVDVLAYERREADHVALLFRALCHRTDQVGWPPLIVEADFETEMHLVTPSEFVERCTQAIANGKPEAMPWGRVVVREGSMPNDASVGRYAPEHLKAVFEHDFSVGQWDGFIGEISMSGRRPPMAIAWRSSSEHARLKKARGITSLFADAAKQVGAGDGGVIYIAYPEGTRAEHADARTADTLKRIRSQEWHYEGGRQIPLVLVSRLYSVATDEGMPDFVENTQQIVDAKYSSIERYFPELVFTYPAE